MTVGTVYLPCFPQLVKKPCGETRPSLTVDTDHSPDLLNKRNRRKARQDRVQSSGDTDIDLLYTISEMFSQKARQDEVQISVNTTIDLLYTVSETVRRRDETRFKA